MFRRMIYSLHPGRELKVAQTSFNAVACIINITVPYGTPIISEQDAVIIVT